MSSDRQAKTEKPTPKRMREARKNGQIPKSTEFVSWSLILVASFMMPLAFSKIGKAMEELQYQAAALMTKPSETAPIDFLGEGLKNAGLALAPIVGTIIIIILVTSASQTAPSVQHQETEALVQEFQRTEGH